MIYQVVDKHVIGERRQRDEEESAVSVKCPVRTLCAGHYSSLREAIKTRDARALPASLHPDHHFLLLKQTLLNNFKIFQPDQMTKYD